MDAVCKNWLLDRFAGKVKSEDAGPRKCDAVILFGIRGDKHKLRNAVARRKLAERSLGKVLLVFSFQKENAPAMSERRIISMGHATIAIRSSQNYRISLRTNRIRSAATSMKPLRSWVTCFQWVARWAASILPPETDTTTLTFLSSPALARYKRIPSSKSVALRPPPERANAREFHLRVTPLSQVSRCSEKDHVGIPLRSQHLLPPHYVRGIAVTR